MSQPRTYDWSVWRLPGAILAGAALIATIGMILNVQISRLTAIEPRVQAVEEKVDRQVRDIEKRVDALTQQLDELEGQQRATSTPIGKTETDLGNMRGRLDASGRGSAAVAEPPHGDLPPPATASSPSGAAAEAPSPLAPQPPAAATGGASAALAEPSAPFDLPAPPIAAGRASAAVAEPPYAVPPPPPVIASSPSAAVAEPPSPVAPQPPAVPMGGASAAVTEPPSPVAPAASSRGSIPPALRARIKPYVIKETGQPETVAAVPTTDAKAAVGASVPEGVDLKPLPPETGVSWLRYGVVNGQTVLAEPKSRRIVDILQ